MNRLSERERRLIAILILLTFVALLWLGLISPLINGFIARAEERVALQQEFARNERQIASISRLRDAIEKQRLSNADFRTSGATLADATEAVKERLSDVVSVEGGELRAIQDVSNREGWARIWVEARMTLPQLLSVLTKLQNQTPFLAFDSVTIGADQALQTGSLDKLDVRIEVSSPITVSQSR